MDASSGMTGGGAMLGGGTMLNCYGYPIPERQGNWQGHVFPGSIFLVWGVHWMLGTFWRFVAATRSGKAFHSRTTEGLLPFVPGIKAFNRKVPLESILKAVGGLLLFFLQLYYGKYKYLVCEDGVRQGRLATSHLNSWAHASMNLGFSLSGIVELTGRAGGLPECTEQAFLSLAFFIEAMLFSLHEKNGALDQTLHFLLAQACWAGALFSALEVAWPSSVLLSTGRIGSMLLQGTWFCQSARVLFEGRIAWSDSFNGAEDEAPSMFLPLVFGYHLLSIAAFMHFAFLGIAALGARLLPAAAASGCAASGAGRAGAGAEDARLLSRDDMLDDEDDEEKTPDQGMHRGSGGVMLATLGGARRC